MENKNLLKPEQELEVRKEMDKIQSMTDREKSQYILELLYKFYIDKNYYNNVIKSKILK